VLQVFHLVNTAIWRLVPIAGKVESLRGELADLEAELQTLDNTLSKDLDFHLLEQDFTRLSLEASQQPAKTERYATAFSLRSMLDLFKTLDLPKERRERVRYFSKFYLFVRQNMHNIFGDGSTVQYLRHETEDELSRSAKLMRRLRLAYASF